MRNTGEIHSAQQPMCGYKCGLRQVYLNSNMSHLRSLRDFSYSIATDISPLWGWNYISISRSQTVTLWLSEAMKRNHLCSFVYRLFICPFSERVILICDLKLFERTNAI